MPNGCWRRPRRQGSRAVLAYADCGTYGALDKLAAQAGVSRLPGLHCYDLYAGAAAIEQLFAEEPGTYLLTDYLIKSFERSVIQPLGLDRYPELWPDYFGHYRRLVWLVQQQRLSWKRQPPGSPASSTSH